MDILKESRKQLIKLIMTTIRVFLVIQVVGTAVSVSGARSLWVQHHRGRCAYTLVATLTCLCTVVALMTPAGF